MIDFNAQTDMARVMNMTLNTVLPEVVEDRQMNPPDVRDVDLSGVIKLLKEDREQWEDICVDLCDSNCLPDLLMALNRGEDQFFLNAFKILMAELWDEKAHREID